MLRPLDIVVMLKLSLENSERPPYLRLANELHLYPSEVYASVKRARASHLGSRSGTRRPPESLLAPRIPDSRQYGMFFPPRSELRPEVFRRAMPLLHFRKPLLMRATCRLFGPTRMGRFVATALRPSTRMSRKLHWKTSAFMNCWPWWMLSATAEPESGSWQARS